MGKNSNLAFYNIQAWKVFAEYGLASRQNPSSIIGRCTIAEKRRITRREAKLHYRFVRRSKRSRRYLVWRML